MVFFSSIEIVFCFGRKLPSHDVTSINNRSIRIRNERKRRKKIVYKVRKKERKFVSRSDACHASDVISLIASPHNFAILPMKVKVDYKHTDHTQCHANNNNNSNIIACGK